MAERVLIIAAHPDDEVLGCGGTLRRHAVLGDEVHILFLADGVSSRDGTMAGVEERQAAAIATAKKLGAEKPEFLLFPDNRLDTVPQLELAKAIENSARRVSPTIVYVHNAGDLNVDHRAVYQSAMVAFRPFPESAVKGIFAFETASSTEWSPSGIGASFVPDRFVDISAYLDMKLELLRLYEKEMRKFPHPRSQEAVTALARWRGASAGVAAAEAFMTVRWIEK